MEGPKCKKFKSDNCLICCKEAVYSDKQDVYTKVLINHLVPPSRWEKICKDSYVFSFCNQCEDVLENLCQLKDDFCPQVNLSKSNSLIKSLSKLKESDQENKANVVVSAPKDSPISTSYAQPGKDEKAELSDIPNLKMVPVPKLFPTIVNKSCEDEAAENDSNCDGNKIEGSKVVKVGGSLEDSIVVVTQPPKFVTSQWNVYYENYKDMYKCKFCSTIMKGENLNQSLARHINIIHAKNNRFKCGVCFGVFFSRNKCRSHIAQVHFQMFNLEAPTTKNDKIDDSPAPGCSKAALATDSTQTSVAKKKTCTSSILKRALETSSTTPTITTNTFQTNSSGCEKYADDKIRSEVVINLEPKTKYNFMEDTVKFEPWDESSTDCVNSVNPFEDLTEMTPTEETKLSHSSTVEADVKSQSEAPVEEIKLWPKPNIPRSWLCIIAVKNLGGDYAYTWDVYDFISTNFPYYQTAKGPWKKHIYDGLKTKIFKQKTVMYGHKPESTKIFAVNEDKIGKLRILIRDCLKENSAAMAFPENLDSFIENVMGDDQVDSQHVMIPDALEDAVCSAEDDEKKDVEHRVWTRPALTYVHLAVIALTNSDHKNLPTKAINDFVRDNFPFFDNDVTISKKTWRGYLASVLPRNAVFVRSTAENLTATWTLNAKEIDRVKENIKNILMVQSHSIYWSLRYPDKFEQLIYNTVGEDIDMDYIKNNIGKSPLEAPNVSVTPTDPNQDGVVMDNSSQYYESSFHNEESMGFEDDANDALEDDSTDLQYGNIEVTDFKFEQSSNGKEEVTNVGDSQVEEEEVEFIEQVESVQNSNMGIIEIDDHSTNSSYVYTVSEDNTIVRILL